MTSRLHNIYKTAAIRSRYGLLIFWFFNCFRPLLLWIKLKIFVSELFQVRITSAGRCVILCSIVLFALNVSRTFFPVLSLLLYILFLGLSLSFLFRPQMKVVCSFPDRVTVGKEIEISLTVVNLSKIPAFEIFAGMLPVPDEFNVVSYDIVSCLKAGKKTELRLKLLPLQRGIYQLSGPSCFSLFPFHLFRSGKICRDKQILIVQPDYFPIAELDIPMIKSYQGSCHKLNSQTGDSLEFVGNREYRCGDALKNIDMKAWAKASRPVVREFGQEYYSNVGIILDNYVAPEKNTAGSCSACFEAAVSITASIIDRLCHDEHLITFFAADKCCLNFHSIRNITVLHKVLEELAVISETNDNDLDGHITNILKHINKLSVVIFVLTHLDDQRIATIESIRQMGCNVKTIVISDNKHTDLPRRAGKDIHLISSRQIARGSLRRV
jgi:uncharacterized protein (DUF58 family)